ncbi:helix-turn-helix domain-containing protein [Gordonia sp. 1D]|uniref:helix-turn-helix domain-containing protein n=1 Tax=Gordonia sp. 1D TaxID=1737359 RepID=UPI000BB95EAC|nr:hypothetical protein CNO18_07345 [Gordonia sp. 1D]
MSYELTSWALTVERPAEAGADWTTVKLTLATMASFADARGRECFASVATIAGRVGVSQATVKRAIRSLTQLGLIVASETQVPGRPTRFQFADVGPGEPEPRSPMTQVNVDPGHDRPRSTLTQGVGHPRPMGRVTVDPQTSSLTGELTGVARQQVQRPRLSLVSGTPSKTCDRHPDGTDKPCAACGEARRQRQEFEKNRRLAALESDREQRRRAAAAVREAIRACGMCDDHGYRGSRPCDHDPDRNARHVRGMAKVRAALAGGGAS